MSYCQVMFQQWEMVLDEIENIQENVRRKGKESDSLEKLD